MELRIRNKHARGGFVNKLLLTWFCTVVLGGCWCAVEKNLPQTKWCCLRAGVWRVDGSQVWAWSFISWTRTSQSHCSSSALQGTHLSCRFLKRRMKTMNLLEFLQPVRCKIILSFPGFFWEGKKIPRDEEKSRSHSLYVLSTTFRYKTDVDAYLWSKFIFPWCCFISLKIALEAELHTMANTHVFQSTCSLEVFFQALRAWISACLPQLPACCSVNVHYNAVCALFCTHLLLEVYA